MALNNSSSIITEWNLRTGQAVKSVDDLYRAIKREQAEERKLTTIRSELDRQTAKTVTSFDKMAESIARTKKPASALSDIINGQTTKFALMAAGGNLLSTAITTVGGVMIDAAKHANDYSQAANIYRGDLDAAKVATDGLASSLDIMTAKNKLATLGVKMTDDEYNEMLGSLTKLSTAMNIDMKFGLESVATMLARQSIPVADNIGVVIKLEDAYKKYAVQLGKTVNELTSAEKKFAFQQFALEQMHKKAAELPERQATFIDRAIRQWVSFSDAVTKAASSVNVSLGKIIKRTESAYDNLYKKSKFFRDFMSIIGHEDTVFGGIGALLIGQDVAGENERKFQYWKAYQKMLAAGEKPIKNIQGGGPKTYNPEDERHIGANPWDKPSGKNNKKFDQIFAATSSQELARINGILARKEEMAKIDAEALENVKKRSEIWTTMHDKISSIAKGSRSEAYDALSQESKVRLGLEQAGFKVSASDIDKYIEAMARYGVTLSQLLDPQQRVIIGQKAIAGASKDMADTLNASAISAVGSMWSVADTAIQTGQSFGIVALQMLKQITLGLAGQLTAKGAVCAIEAAALALTPGMQWLAAIEKTKAGIYFAGAASVGAMGLSLSAATAARASSGGGSGVSSSVGRGSSAGGYSGSTAPSISTKRTPDPQPINIQVYIGDPSDPTSALIARKQINAIIQRQQDMYREV